MLKVSFIAAMVMLSGALAQAETILFSNLVEPGAQYGFDDVGFGNTPGSQPENRNRALAVRFSVSAASILSSFRVPLNVRSGPNEVNAFLLSDASGTPGSVIETYLVTGLSSGAPTPLTTIPSISGPTLTAGEDYWFAVTAGQSTFAGWTLTLFQGNSNGSLDFATGGVIGDPTSVWNFGSGGAGAREGTLVVVGEAVPEPHTLLPAALFLLILITTLRRRGTQRAWQKTS